MNESLVCDFQNGVRLTPGPLRTAILMTLRPDSGDQNIARSLNEFMVKVSTSWSLLHIVFEPFTRDN